MINYPTGLSESELQLYIAAFQRCRERIEELENNTTVSETVDTVVSRWGGIVADRDLLRKFLLAEVKVPISPKASLVDSTVKDKKWFTNLKKEKGNSLEYWRRYYDHLTHKPTWSLDAIADIDESTDEVLNYILILLHYTFLQQHHLLKTHILLPFV